MVANHARKNRARAARRPGQNHRQAVDAVRTDDPAPRVLVAPGDRVPRDSVGHPACPIDRGDVLRLSCPAGTAKVVEVWEDHTAVIEWPWRDKEDGGRRPTFAVRIPEAGTDQFAAPFRVPLLTRDVREGDTFTVDMPPTVVHVVYTTDTWLAADRDAGRPPADSHVIVAALPHGVSEAHNTEGARLMLRPWSAEPVTVELLCRPYEAVPDGAEVVDADGDRWAYTAPLDWHAPGRSTARTEGPVWPLTLTAQYTFEPDQDAVDAVAAATATGSHDEELGRWRRASGADLVPFETSAPEGLSDEELEQVAAATRRRVAGMTRDQVAEQRENARVAYRLVSKSVQDEDEWKVVQATGARFHALDEVLAELDAGTQETARAVVRDAVAAAYPDPAPDCCGHVTCRGDGPCGWVLAALLDQSPRCECRGRK